MNTGRYLFAQLMDFLPKTEFDRCVQKYRGNRRMRRFSCYDQFLCMMFAQLTRRLSLRDVELCLHSFRSKLYHVGFRGAMARNTLAHANQHRDWRIYAEFAHILIARARTLYATESFGVTLSRTIYALDSTTIALCLTLFPWAAFRRRKAAIKLHTLIDLRGNIPSFIRISCGKMHDVVVLDTLPVEPDAVYVMDRGYVDFARLYRFETGLAFFVTRAKKGMRFRRVTSRPVDPTTGLRADQTIRLTGSTTGRDYPHPLRRIKYVDPQSGKQLVFLTNNFEVNAHGITQLYKSRWQVELFFKWIKQRLRIKTFYGTSENAVKTQIWIAISVYVLVAIIKKELNIELSMTEILHILSLNLFEKTSVLTVFS